MVNWLRKVHEDEGVLYRDDAVRRLDCPQVLKELTNRLVPSSRL